MSRLQLTLACLNYDRVRALADGRVRPEGIDLKFLDLRPEVTFPRMLRHHEFDVAELSLSFYAMAIFNDPQAFVAIPVFTSRAFRHSGIFIATQSGIREPQDLIGKRVGAAGYHMTAMLWIRGMLQDEYGVKAEACEYWSGGEEQPSDGKQKPLELPSRFKLRDIGPGQTLVQMLANGEIDALHSPRIPSTFHTQPTKVQRLFENYREIELAYYRKARIFPIMHVIALRREVYEQNRWIAVSLYNAFVEAQRICYDELYEAAALRNMLPWMIADIEELRREMGNDWWPYGYASNRHVLDTFLRYHDEQGLSKRRLKSEELFVPETLAL